MRSRELRPPDVKVCAGAADKGRHDRLSRVAGLLALIGLWVVLTNNSFIRARNKVDESWSGIDVQLKRRHDLVPNLVDTVKGYAAHENATLAAVTQARSAAMAAGTGAERSAAEAQLTGALDGIRVVAEEYPELRASESFRALQAELSELEDQIQAARRIYNANVNAYNTRIQLFPNSLVAGRSFTARDLFQLDSPAERPSRPSRSSVGPGNANAGRSEHFRATLRRPGVIAALVLGPSVALMLGAAYGGPGGAAAAPVVVARADRGLDVERGGSDRGEGVLEARRRRRSASSRTSTSGSCR